MPPRPTRTSPRGCEREEAGKGSSRERGDFECRVLGAEPRCRLVFSLRGPSWRYQRGYSPRLAGISGFNLIARGVPGDSLAALESEVSNPGCPRRLKSNLNRSVRRLPAADRIHKVLDVVE